MTTSDLLFDSTTAPSDRGPRFFAVLQRLWAGFRRRRAERRAIISLSRLDERLLRDMGIEPQDVTAALNGRAAPSILFHPMRRKADHE